MKGKRSKPHWDMSLPKKTGSTIANCDRNRRTAKILVSGKLTVRNSAAWCLAKTIVIPKPAREGRYGGQYCCTSSILSAVFKAKADTKDRADGFSRKRETITFFDFFRCPKLLLCDHDYIWYQLVYLVSDMHCYSLLSTSDEPFN
jgi:hypothetical protein